MHQRRRRRDAPEPLDLVLVERDNVGGGRHPRDARRRVETHARELERCGESHARQRRDDGPEREAERVRLVDEVRRL